MPKMSAGAIATNVLRSVNAARSPTPPAVSESSRLSASARRASRILPAPTAARIANSRWRSATRASMRFATFTHAISRKTATAPRSSQPTRAASPIRRSRSGCTFQATRMDGGQNFCISGNWGASITFRVLGCHARLEARERHHKGRKGNTRVERTQLSREQDVGGFSRHLEVRRQDADDRDLLHRRESAFRDSACVRRRPDRRHSAGPTARG